MGTIVKKEEEEEVRVAAGQKWQQEPKQSRIRLGSEDLLLNHAQLSSNKKTLCFNTTTTTTANNNSTEIPSPPLPLLPAAIITATATAKTTAKTIKKITTIKKKKRYMDTIREMREMGGKKKETMMNIKNEVIRATVDTTITTPLHSPSNNNNKNNKNNISKNNNNKFRYQEVVRNKKERQSLKGRTCEDCINFVNAICDGNGSKFFKKDGSIVTECSRHRSRHTPPSTPADFWELSFPDERREREEKEKEKEKEGVQIKTDLEDAMNEEEDKESFMDC